MPDDGNPTTNESEATFYTEYGEVDYTIDFNGAKVDHVYDYELGSGLTTKLGRMARIDLYDPSNSKVETIAYTYDLFGRTDTITETEGSTVRITDTDYDIEGRIVKITRPEGWIAYGYDDATSRHTKTWTANSEWSYEDDLLTPRSRQSIFLKLKVLIES